MEQYFSKTAVMAEIDRRIQFFTKESGSSNSDIVIALFGLKSYLDTLDVKEVDESRYNDFLGKELQMVDNEIDRLEKLKVKEVDLEKEFERFLNEVEGVPRMWHSDEQIEWAKGLAKHFLELGVKAQKGE